MTGESKIETMADVEIDDEIKDNTNKMFNKVIILIVDEEREKNCNKTGIDAVKLTHTFLSIPTFFFYFFYNFNKKNS